MDEIDLSDWDDLFWDIENNDFPMGERAYIKREVVNFRPIYSIYDSEGQLLAQASSRYKAFLMARRNDLTPYDVH
ncbi:MAG: hypothetical protein SPL08_02025 [Pseudomonadota bacterium]|nr:hypothetical protein [Pseudomonadota bacterium]